jgi:UDPglucose 6-dehydrogenase
VVEESAGIALAMRLCDAGYVVKVFDPAAADAGRTMLGAESAAASMDACARDADVLVITTAWPQFASLHPASLCGVGRRPVIIDCWRVLPKERFEDVADVVYLGYGNEPRTAACDMKSPGRRSW